MTSKPMLPSRGYSPEDIESKIVGLFETCYVRISRYIALRIGKAHEAEDLASEVFVRALRKAPTYQDTGKPMEAWLFRIAHNLVVDYLRKSGKLARQLQLEDIPEVAGSDSADDGLERDEQLAELKRAIAQLPPAQKEVVNLRFGAGLRPDEIAATIGKKPTTVRWLQHAAIERLRTILVPSTNDGPVNGTSPS